MTAAEKLLRWRLSQGLSQRDAAAQINLSQAAWQSYESGGHPRVGAATNIERLTKGAVRVGDWADSEVEIAARRAKSAAKRVRKPKKKAAESGPLPSDSPHAKSA